MEEKTQKQINAEIHIALYGDSSTGELGVVQKTNEIYEILYAFRLFGRAVMWIALFLGGLGTAFAGLWGPIKHFFTGK